MAEIHSKQIEKHCLAGLLNYPDIYSEIERFSTPESFFLKEHQIIFKVVRDLINNKKTPDPVIIAERIKNLKVQFDSEFNIYDYVESLSYIKLKKNAALDAYKTLLRYQFLRNACETARNIYRKASEHKDDDINNIVTILDQEYSKISNIYKIENEFENLYSNLHDFIEEIGNNPPDESSFLYGPFPTINKTYGSLLRPANITMIGARSKAGKSSLGMYYLTKVCDKYKIPILHLDMGEMTQTELKFRAAVMLSGGQISYHLLESGLWRKNPVYVDIVRKYLPKVKELKYCYRNVGSMNGSQILSTIRRFYLNEVGRGNRFVVHYDYLKPFDFNPNMPEWKEMGHFIQDVKSFMTDEIPEMSMWTSLQLNRSGITNGKKIEDIDDSEGTFSISDRISQQVSHAFILRNKTLDQLQKEGQTFGNMILKCVLPRHLGSDPENHFVPVNYEGKAVSNYINLSGKNFVYQEMGDLREMAAILDRKKELNEDNGDQADL